MNVHSALGAHKFHCQAKMAWDQQIKATTPSEEKNLHLHASGMSKGAYEKKHNQEG